MGVSILSLFFDEAQPLFHHQTPLQPPLPEGAENGLTAPRQKGPAPGQATVA